MGPFGGGLGGFKTVLLVILGLLITKVPSSSSLGGQTASGPPSYIQVGPPGSDFRGPGAQKKTFKGQKTPKLIILGLLKFVRNSPIKPVTGSVILIITPEVMRKEEFSSKELLIRSPFLWRHWQRACPLSLLVFCGFHHFSFYTQRTV